MMAKMMAKMTLRGGLCGEPTKITTQSTSPSRMGFKTNPNSWESKREENISGKG